MNKPTYEQLEAQVKQLAAKAELHEAAERAWERTMMRVCGEDGVLSVAGKFNQLAAENAGMDSFVKAMLAIAWQGSSADGSDIQELALKCGLIRQEVYCADKHENMVDDPGNFEDGDALYFRVETPATDAILASLRAEGVDMAMEAAKPEVANEFQRETFDQCVTAAVKYPQSDLAGKVEMVAWLELFAAQLRSKSEVQS